MRQTIAHAYNPRPGHIGALSATCIADLGCLLADDLDGASQGQAQHRVRVQVCPLAPLDKCHRLLGSIGHVLRTPAVTK